MGIERLVAVGSKLTGRAWIDERLLGFVAGGRAKAAPAFASPGVLVVLALSAGAAVYWSGDSKAHHRGDVASEAVTSTVEVEGRRYVGEDSTLSERTLLILQTDDYLSRSYEAVDGSDRFHLLVVFSPDNRKGTHPPDVCLKGAGEEVVSKRLHELSPPGMQSITMRELITVHKASQRKSVHLYVYKCGDAYTPSFMMQQVTIFLNGLTNRNAAGALIHLTAPISPVGDEDQATAAAREKGLAAAREMLPEIDRGLP
jgi:EpsI family protein